MKPVKFLATVMGLLIAGSALADGQVNERSKTSTSQPVQATESTSINPGAAALEDTQTSTEETTAVRNSMPIYSPPRRGAPKTRVGGGTRSTGSAVQLALLAPEHTGLTGRPSPMLYWWLSQDHEGPFEFVVIAEGEIEPTLRFRQQTRLAAGIHVFDLAAAGLTLKPDVAYRWSVAIVRDEARRARDVVALATMRYVLDRSPVGDTDTLAAAGLWYDAVAAATAEASTAARTDLLEQVALDQVAVWSRQES